MFNGLATAHQIFKESYGVMYHQSPTKLGKVLGAMKMLGWSLFLGLYLVVASCFVVVGSIFVPAPKVKELSQ